MRRAAVLALLLGSLLGCTTLPPAAAPEAGGLIEARALAWYPAWFLRAALRFADVPGPTPIRCGVRTWRILYWSEDANGSLERASGLLAAPTCARSRAVVSYQHGSVSRRDDVPSGANLEGIAAAAVFAGGGYLTVAADYPGMGASTAPSAYLHAEATAAATRDLLRAGRRFTELRERDWPAATLLTGFSQGGHATAALLRALEMDPEGDTHILGAAIGSAPFDLPGQSFPWALEGASRDHAAYLAYLTHAYAGRYDRPLESVLRPAFAAQAAGLLDGLSDEDDLPRQPREMFTEAFLDAHDRGVQTWLHAALAANAMHTFAPRAPVRVYAGSADETVPARDGERAVQAMQAAGANARFVDLGALDHRDAALAAVPAIRAWFDALTAP